jgi:hypothetical protein
MNGTYSGTLTMNNNDFNSCSNAPAQANAVVGNPMLVNPASDWHLQAGSPAIHTGTAITFYGYDGANIDVSHDKDGVTRSTPWTLGIYNY